MRLRQIVYLISIKVDIEIGRDSVYWFLRYYLMKLLYSIFNEDYSPKALITMGILHIIWQTIAPWLMLLSTITMLLYYTLPQSQQFK